MTRFVVAVAVSLAFVLSAPFVGQLRARLLSAFPRHYVLVVSLAVAGALAAAAIYALLRVRDRRGARYGAMAAAAAMGVAWTRAFSTGVPEVDIVERVHFVQYGVIALLFYRAWRPAGDASVFVLPVLAGILVAAVEEWFQWFIPVRIGEIRDVFLNLTAILCGLVFSAALDPPPRVAGGLNEGSAGRIGWMAAAVIVALAVFLHVLHLGHEIHDEQAGSFKSRYTRGELRAEAADRAVRWSADPPVTLRRLSAEDQYMSEGLWHVQWRNEAWEARDLFTAWRENLILERYFTPVLDTPSYVSRVGHRWPPAQREEAAAAAAADERPYSSEANPYPILLWPRWLLWIAALALAAGVRWLATPQRSP